MAQTAAATGTVVGYFEDHSQAVQAVEGLQNAGFSSAHLGVAYRGGGAVEGGQTEVRKNGETGGETGVWGKLRNFFGADDSEPYADERTQGDLANREITPNPADSYAAGSNDFHNNLRGLNVPDDRSRYFGHRFENADQGAVVTVNAEDRQDEAATILKRYGADLGENADNYDYPETSGSQYAGSASPVSQGNGYAASESTTPQNIQLLGEVLRVHKDRVSRGEVRLRKEVVTEMQTVQVPVTHEELVIERRAVDGQAAQGTIGSGEEIRIPLTEETASVDKSTVVREEVSVGKKAVEEVRDLTSDVRHEELQVEDATRRVS